MKTTKRTILCIALSWLMVFGGIITPVLQVQAEVTVLVTRTGSKYHTHKCGNGTYYESTLSEAKARGLTPCQKCYGNKDTSNDDVQSSANNTTNKDDLPKPISISSNSIELIKGQSKKVKVKNASGTIQWSSEDESVAIVSNGTVKAKGKGRTTITVFANGQKKSCKVKVEEPQISQTKLNIALNDEKQLKIIGCEHDITWTSSNDNIVSVDGNGYLYAENLGKATIAGKVHGKRYRCKVTVELPKINNMQIVNPIDTIGMNMDFSLEVITDNDTVFEYTDVEAKSSDNSIISIRQVEKGMISLESKAHTGTATIIISIGEVQTSCKITVVDYTMTDDNHTTINELAINTYA